MIKIGIAGAAGKMGQTIIRLALKDRNFRLTAAIESKGHGMLGRDAGSAVGMEISGVKIETGQVPLKKADVLIDFSSPAVTVSNLEFMADLKRPVVIGTTGFSDAQKRMIKKIANRIPIVMSSNMSIGVNLLFKLLPLVVSAMKDYDVEIIEAHHRMKKDAPSGTAKRIAEIITAARKLDIVSGRCGICGPRKNNELGILAVRAGEIVGDHTVLFAGPGECFEITHRALSRDTFGKGALLAAAFALKAKKGLYDMQDVLGLK